MISDDFQIGPNGAYEHVGNELDKRMKSDIPMKCDIRKYLKYLKDRKKKNRIKNEECCKNKEYDTNNPSTKN